MLKNKWKHPFLIKLFNWEYWPFHVVYAPLYPYWFWLCLKARSFFFFSASNPTIENGGFLMESKKKIYDLMPQEFYPRTLFFPLGSSVDEIIDMLNEQQFTFPLIGKPDIGGRGRGVRKLDNLNDVAQYARTAKLDFLLQEYIDYGLEAGIFYYRIPGEKKGVVSGIVAKELLAITGDGRSTVRELMHHDQRHILQMDVLEKTIGTELNQVLPAGENRILVPYGNHCRGAKFTDASTLIDDQLNGTIDRICKQVNGFYYGRMDIRFKSWEEMKRGGNFSIIELNGAGSEPTHIYDSNHTIFFAWKEIIRHWNILYKISMKNRQKHPFMKWKDGIRMFRENSKYEKLMEQEEENVGKSDRVVFSSSVYD